MSERHPQHDAGESEAILDALVERARRSDEEAEADLSDAAWARIRAAMPDRAPEAAEAGTDWLWLAAGAAAAAAFALVIAFGGFERGPEERSIDVLELVQVPESLQEAPEQLAQPAAGPGSEADLEREAVVEPAPETEVESEPEVAVEPPQAKPALAAGQRFDVGEVTESVTGFGRHRLSVAPKSTLEVLAWSDDRVVLDLIEGQLDADVNRRSGDEIFEVRAGRFRIRVVGTTFQVVHRDGEVRVSVTHGLVSITGVGEERRIAAGEDVELVAAPAARPTRVAGTKPRPAKPKATPATEPRVVDIQVPDAEMARPVEEPSQGEGKKEIVIEVPPQEMPAAQLISGYRDRLVPIVGLIRGGGCGSAIAKLRAIARETGARRTPPDVLYLMGWCHRKLGQAETSEAFFDRYRRVVGKGRWALPKGPDDTLPLPRASQLSP